MQLISTVHALLYCHTNNKKKSVYLLTATISFGEFLLRKVFFNLSCHWSRGSTAQWHLWQKWWQTPVRDMALERLFDLVAKAQYILFSRASDNHNPDLVVIQRITFLKMRQERTWGFGEKKKKNLMLSLSLNTTPMMGMFHLFLNYFSPDTRREREPPACPSKTIQHWKTKVSLPLHYPNMNRGARNHSP